MKYAGLTAIGISLSFSGVFLFMKNKKRAYLCGILSEFFSAFSGFISLEGLDTKGAFRRASAMFPTLGFLIKISEEDFSLSDISKIWTDIIKEDSIYYVLRDNQRKLLLSFPSVLTTSSMDNFLKGSGKLSDDFRKEKEREEKNIEKSGTLTVYAGFLAAAAIIIVAL